jgi:hypothetical protein
MRVLARQQLLVPAVIRRGQGSNPYLAMVAAAQALVTPGTLSAPLALTRAQVTTQAMARGTDGVTWSEFAADTARFMDAPRGLLVEGQRTNQIRNPRGEGGTTGVINGGGGAMPTNWSAGPVNPFNGVTITRQADQTLNGIPGIVLNFAGTSTSAALTPVQYFDAGTTFVPASGTVTGVVFGALVGGSFANVASLLLTQGGTGVVNGDFLTVGASPTPVISTTTANGTVNRLAWRYGPSGTGVAVNFSIWWGAPQFVLADFLGTPILPTVGTTGSAPSRGRDIVTAALAGLSLPASGAGTYLWAGRVPQAAPAGADQVLLQIDDGSDANRIRLRNVAGGSSLQLLTTLATVDANTALGSLTPGSRFALAMAVDGTGNARASLNGGAAVTLAGAPTSGLTTLRLGNNFAGAAAMFGTTEQLRFMPTVASAADLAGMAAVL